MAINYFTFDPKNTDRYLQFGQNVYHSDPNYLPVENKSIARLFSPQYSFYLRNGNTHRHFFATRDGEILGRISAFRNKDLKDRDGEPIGCVGFFECVNDYDIASDLLQAAINWLYREQDIKRIWGPINFDIWHGYRFMIKGFEYKTFLGEPYNKSYYPEYIERFGFRIRQQWDTVELHGKELLFDLIKKGLVARDTLLEKGYRFEPFKLSRFSSEINKLYTIIQNSFSGFLGFTPIDLSEFARLFIPVRSIIDSRFFLFIYDEQDNLAGFAGAFPEISDWIRMVKEKNRYLSKFKFLIRRPPPSKILFFFGGISQQEAAKRSGLGKAAFAHTIEQILKAGFDQIIIALMAADSRARGLVKGNWATGHRQYALYQYDVQA